MLAVIWLWTSAIWGKIVKPLLTITIPVPLFAILVVAVWLYFDQTSLTKLKNEMTQIIAGAQLKAKDDLIAAQKKIADQKARIADTATANETDLAKVLSDQQAQNQELQNEIAKLQSQPVPADCLVGQSLFDELRNH